MKIGGRRIRMPGAPKPEKRRLNADEKTALNASNVGLFVSEYGRKAHAGHDPNDRHYDRKVEAAIKALSPEDLDRLLRDDEN